MKLARIPWFLALFIIVSLGTTVSLVLLRNERGAYERLKKEDADRIYVLQKITVVSQEDVNKLESAFLKESEIITFIQALEATRPLFDSLDLSFTSDAPEGKGVLYLPFTVSVSGEKKTVDSFVQALLSSTYALEIKKIDRTRNEENPTRAQLLMTGNIYIEGSTP